MKIEAKCMNAGCPTASSRQLLEAHFVHIDRAFDEDHNLIECPICGAAVEVVAVARHDAQFPVGDIQPSDQVLEKVVAGDVEKGLLVSDLVSRHARGDHGSATRPTDRTGIIYSMFEFRGRLLWIYTNRARTLTKVTLAWEDDVGIQCSDCGGTGYDQDAVRNPPRTAKTGYTPPPPCQSCGGTGEIEPDGED